MGIRADIALEESTSDRYGFSVVAEHVATALARIPAATGLVIGIEGEWGSGKSTFANYIATRLKTASNGKSPLIVRYNAWIAVDESEAASGLLLEISNALYAEPELRQEATRTDALKEEVRKWVAFIKTLEVDKANPGARVGLRGMGLLLGTGSIEQLKRRIGDAMRVLDRRLYVVVDDLDRMAAQHLRLLFATIKTVCDLPDVVFILVLDKLVVANALAQVQGGDGMAYLDKIVSLAVPVPYIDPEDLLREFLRRLSEDLGLDLSAPRSEKWAVVIRDGVLRFLRKPRDVVRLANAISLTYPSVRRDVSFDDFVALEALRLFEPAVHAAIKINAQHLVQPISGESEIHAKRVLSEGPAEAHVQRERTLACLFPRAGFRGGKTLDSEVKGVGERRNFSIYFQFGLLPGTLSETDYEGVLSALDASATEFAERLRWASSQPIRGSETVLQAVLDRLCSENWQGLRSLNLVVGMCTLSDSEVASWIHGHEKERGYDVLRHLTFLLRTALRGYLPNSFDALVTSIRAQANSGLILKVVLEVLREIARDRQDPTEFNAALKDLSEVFGSFCSSRARDGGLFKSARLNEILQAWADSEGTESVRKNLATIQLTASAAERLVETFFTCVAATNAGEVQHNIEQYFDILIVDSALEQADESRSSDNLKRYREYRERSRAMSFLHASKGPVSK